jgi:nucleoside-diphosphate-sugar epimerase
MALAIEWAIVRKPESGGNFLAVNTGSNEWNYQVKDLAYEVAKIVPDVKVSINADAPPDKRSYRVNFDLYKKLAPNHQPKYNLESTIRDLKINLELMNFRDSDYRNSFMIRLKILNQLQESGMLNNQLNWNW